MGGMAPCPTYWRVAQLAGCAILAAALESKISARGTTWASSYRGASRVTRDALMR